MHSRRSFLTTSAVLGTTLALVPGESLATILNRCRRRKPRCSPRTINPCGRHPAEYYMYNLKQRHHTIRGERFNFHLAYFFNYFPNATQRSRELQRAYDNYISTPATLKVNKGIETQMYTPGQCIRVNYALGIGWRSLDSNARGWGVAENHGSKWVVEGDSLTSRTIRNTQSEPVSRNGTKFTVYFYNPENNGKPATKYDIWFHIKAF